VGDTIGDAIRNIIGDPLMVIISDSTPALGGKAIIGYMPSAYDKAYLVAGSGLGYGRIAFDASLDPNVTVAKENRPASISTYNCITY